MLTDDVGRFVRHVVRKQAFIGWMQPSYCSMVADNSLT
jgi:hypothetical protein